MNNWMMDRLEFDRDNRYQVLADALCEAVNAGRLLPGTRLPTHRALAEQLDISVSTVTRAYREAGRRGYIESTVGRGSYVAEQPAANGDDSSAFTGSEALRFPGDEAPLDQLNLPRLHGGGLVDLSLNEPYIDPSNDVIDTALRKASRQGLFSRGIGYYSPAGSTKHRKAGAKWLGELGVSTRAANVLIVPGGQSALTSIALAFIGSGGTLLCEEMTWPGMLTLAATMGMRIESVSMDREGIVPEALEEAVRRSGSRTLYTMPNHHNPTGITMNENRREQIAAIARKHKLLVIEDDAYGFATLGKHPPIREFLPESTVYLTSMSKPINPALRIGYLVASEAIRTKLVSVLRATTMLTSPVIAEIATQLIELGKANELATLQSEIALRRQKIAGEVGLVPAESVQNCMHLWMRVGPVWSTQEFVARALSLGVSVSPGTVFAAKAGADPNAVRICLNAEPSEQRLRQALSRLASLASAEEFAYPFV